MSSWADATEEEPIPPPLPQSHPPSAQCPPVLAPEPRPAVAVPDRPPFCAYVANLPFSATEADVRALFGTLSVQPTGVRLPTDKGSDKHKGFAYCTFQDAPTLLTAIGANGVDVQVSARRDGCGLRTGAHAPLARCPPLTRRAPALAARALRRAAPRA